MGGRYWFPLALLGFGLLAMLGWDMVAAQSEFGWFAYAPEEFQLEQTILVGVAVSSDYPEAPASSMRDWTWAALIVATLVVSVAWYAWRARRASGSVRTHVALALAGGLGVATCYVVAGMVEAVADSGGLVPTVGVPLLVLAALAGAWTHFGPGPWRRTAMTIAIVSAVTGVATVLGGWSPALIEPVLIGAGLLALARYEHSRLLAVTAVLVPAALAVLPAGPLSTLIPATLLLAAAIAALVRGNGSPAPAR